MVNHVDACGLTVTGVTWLLYVGLLSCSVYNMPSFAAGAQLLSSLSGYACTKRAWKKEVFELFMDPLFFTMDASCAHRWVWAYGGSTNDKNGCMEIFKSWKTRTVMMWKLNELHPSVLLKWRCFKTTAGKPYIADLLIRRVFLKWCEYLRFSHLIPIIYYVCSSKSANLLFHSWKSIIDHLLTHEKTMFKDLMGEYHWETFWNWEHIFVLRNMVGNCPNR